MANGTISIRQFARECGVSDTAVHEAIKAGHIDRGVDWNEDRTKKRGIFRDIALKEWKSNHSGHEKPTKSGTPLTFGAKKPDALPRKSVQQIASTPSEPVDKSGPSTAEIKRSTAAVDYQLKKIELEKKKGALVEKSEVYKQLFNAGKKVREAVMLIPDRVIDNIIAAPSRSDAHAILFKELEAALQELSHLPDLQFTSENQ